MSVDADILTDDEALIEDPIADEGDDSGTRAAVALLIALLAFLGAVALVLLRHMLFQA